MNALQLKFEGMEASEDHANQVIENWSELAMTFLIKYAKINKSFLAEDVRNASIETVPTPPSNRAWGGVMVRAKNNGIISTDGYRRTKNPLAHSTPATFWKSNI